MQKLMITFMMLGLTAAYGAGAYRVTLYRSTVVNGTELKAGECKVELHENKLVFKQGKTSAEATVKVETSAQKFPSTTVGYAGDGAANDLQEIRLGGTTTKLLFDARTAPVAGTR